VAQEEQALPTAMLRSDLDLGRVCTHELIDFILGQERVIWRHADLSAIRELSVGDAASGNFRGIAALDNRGRPPA
jgi:hypothetical protein